MSESVGDRQIKRSKGAEVMYIGEVVLLVLGTIVVLAVPALLWSWPRKQAETED